MIRCAAAAALLSNCPVRHTLTCSDHDIHMPIHSTVHTRGWVDPQGYPQLAVHKMWTGGHLALSSRKRSDLQGCCLPRGGARLSVHVTLHMPGPVGQILTAVHSRLSTELRTLCIPGAALLRDAFLAQGRAPSPALLAPPSPGGCIVGHRLQVLREAAAAGLARRHA